MKKIIYKYLIILTILISIDVYIFALRIEEEEVFIPPVSNNIYSGEGSGRIELKDIMTVSSKEKISEKEPLKYMYKVEDDKADLYSLSFQEDNKLEKNSVINLKKSKHKYASDQIYLVFRESYPNIPLEHMGLNTPEEAYQAKQLAIWEIAARTGEAEEYIELAYIESVKEAIGLKNINERVFKKAKDLVKFIEKSDLPQNETINLIPKLIVSTAEINEELKYIEDEYIVGPYSYRVESGILTDTEIIVKDENNNKVGKIVDENGIELNNLEEIMGKEFFVRFPNDKKNIKIQIKTKCKRLTPTIYEDDISIYVVDKYEYNEMEQELKIEIN